MIRRRRRGHSRFGLFLAVVMITVIYINVNAGRDIVLVNNEHALPENYRAELEELPNGLKMDRTAVKPLLKMLDAAEKDGCRPIVTSAYRSVDYQKQLYEKQVKKQQTEHSYSLETARKKAQSVVTLPGHSEHNLGLAADIVSASDAKLEGSFADTKEGKWLKKHCAEYGFILRYPEGKEDITGVIYEPWHFRYVGKSTAKYIMKKGITLEEYCGGKGK